MLKAETRDTRKKVYMDKNNETVIVDKYLEAFDREEEKRLFPNTLWIFYLFSEREV